MKANGRIVVCDMEAGVGTLLRLLPGQADLALVVVQPTAKAVDVAGRAVRIAATRARVLVVANRVRDESDLELIRAGIGDGQEIVVVPDDEAIARADEEGVAPIDAAPDSAGVSALVALAARLAA